MSGCRALISAGRRRTTIVVEDVESAELPVILKA